MNKEEKSIFLSDAFSLSLLILKIHSFWKTILFFIITAIFLSLLYIQTVPTRYLAETIIKGPSNFDNISLLPKYNFYVNEIKNLTGNDELKNLSNEKLFNIWLNAFQNKTVFEKVLSSLKILDKNKFNSETEYEIALKKEISNIRLSFTDLNSFQTKMWDKGLIDTTYLLSYESDNKEISQKLIKHLIDEINKKEINLLITNLNEMIVFLDFFFDMEIKKINKEIEEIKVLTRNKVTSKISFLKNQIKIAKELGILYPQEFENDNYPLIVSNREVKFDNRFFDGEIALNIELDQLEKALESEIAFSNYIKQLNLEIYLELDKIKDNNLKDEINNYKVDLLNSNLKLLNFDENSVFYTINKPNTPIIVLIAIIFALVMSFIYIFSYLTIRGDK